MLRTSQIVSGLLLIPYVAGGIVLCLLVLERKHCNSPYYFVTNYDGLIPLPPTTIATTTVSTSSTSTTSTPSTTPDWDHKRLVERSFEDRFCAGGYHGLWSLMGTLMLGFSIIIYRLLLGVRTRLVKYVHLMLHLITLILFSIGLWCIFTHEYSITYDRINYHGLTSWVVFAIFCLQFVVATVVFTYLHPNTNLRLYVNLFHDLFGIWLFICCVACCISGRRRAQVDYVGISQELFYGLSYGCFTIILIVIVSPFFEWDMVGPL